jgi:hypothetical protein
MRKVFLAIICIALAGCSTAPTIYTQPGATEKSVKIACESESDHTILTGLNQKVFIAAIDGKSTHSIAGELVGRNQYAEAAYLKPGRHYLDIEYLHMNSFAYGHVWFDAEAGKAYVVRRKIKGYEVYFWIEELRTGKIVGGIPGGEPETNQSPNQPSL